MGLSLKQRLAQRCRAKKWRLSHPEAAEATRQRSRQKHPDSYRFSCLKNSSKTRGLQCSIEFEAYRRLVHLPCHYCGSELPVNGHGMDRINPGIGYVWGNLRPCCTNCNIAKNDMTESEFREWSLRLYNHWSGVSR
jgi:hypothetical protein